MKTILITLALSFCLAASSRCYSLYTEGFNTYFWTSSKDIPLYLVIDGKEKGLLPYLSDTPTCDNTALKQKLLMVYLPSGRYAVEIKDAQGNFLYKETLRVKRSGGSVSIGVSTSGKGGGSKRSFEGDCLIEELYHQ